MDLVKPLARKQHGGLFAVSLLLDIPVPGKDADIGITHQRRLDCANAVIDVTGPKQFVLVTRNGTWHVRVVVVRPQGFSDHVLVGFGSAALGQGCVYRPPGTHKAVGLMEDIELDDVSSLFIVGKYHSPVRQLGRHFDRGETDSHCITFSLDRSGSFVK